MEEDWLALAIGNSRLHWAHFNSSLLTATWDTSHLTALPAFALSPSATELWIASVVPEQALLWQKLPTVHWITLDDIPLREGYANLGLDRALAVWAAGELLGWPVLVIDAGTSLTFTGASRDHQFKGGAILPGLRLQLRSLAVKTAQLPEVQLGDQLPSRWGHNTPDAIRSGVVYTVLAGVREFVQAWQQQFSNGAIVLTGGDGETLLSYLRDYDPNLAVLFTLDPHLIFWGIRMIRERRRA
ncbi:pantothenate kinase [Leptolyngbya sp. 'hensonii']|uniref:pantothenate kinase n=1 Tax=Leptolyngbya sp. 'hensonii' TaxID=1922337 RepID=UPI00094F7E6C|nr:pantothenate kinase [Leptolyngbya sp. 'hensonii']OLP17122.1 pantothenate kinase [Leptolyngbya sp. 'hensonii']